MKSIKSWLNLFTSNRFVDLSIREFLKGTCGYFIAKYYICTSFTTFKIRFCFPLQAFVFLQIANWFPKTLFSNRCKKLLIFAEFFQLFFSVRVEIMFFQVLYHCRETGVLKSESFKYWIYTYFISRTEKRKLYCLWMIRNVIGHIEFSSTDRKLTLVKKKKNQRTVGDQKKKKKVLYCCTPQVTLFNVIDTFVNSCHNLMNFTCLLSTLKVREEARFYFTSRLCPGSAC